MAASYIAASAGWTELEADGTVAIPAGGSAGDRIFLFAAWKTYTITCQITSPVGWTEVIEWADGIVDAGNGTGSVKVGCWYKTHDGTESTNPTMDYSSDPTNSASAILIMRPGAGEEFPAPGYVTGAVSSGTGGATTEASSTIAVPTGGVVMAIIGIRDDTATLTRGDDTGIHDKGNTVTWNGNHVELPASHYTDTTGNDLAADLGYRLVTTGAAAQTLTAYTLLSATETGAALWIVQGTQPHDDGPAELAAGSGTAYGATVAAKSSAGLPTTATGTAYAGTPQVRPVAGLGTGTGAAYDAAGQVRPTGGLGSGTGTAYDASVFAKPVAGLAEATGEAFDATVDAEDGIPFDTGPAELAEGTGTAYGATAKVTGIAQLAAATGEAYGATPKVEPNAALATGSGAAADITADIDGMGGVSVATGTAYDATATSAANPTAGHAAGTGAAYDAIPKLGANAEAAAAIGAAFDATGQVRVFAGLASAVGAAYDATVTAVDGGGTTAPAELAGAIGTAYDAMILTSGGTIGGRRKRRPFVPTPDDEEDFIALFV
jgi:hypothetical protein